MGKITIKHYLNTNLKPYIIDNEKYFRIYVLIRADTQNTKIKSDADTNEYTEKEFEKIVNNPESETFKAIIEETKIIEFIVNKMKEDKKVFSSALFSEYSKRFKKPISDFISIYNSIYDPLFDVYEDKHIGLAGHEFKEIFNTYINEFSGLIAKNYEIKDLFMVQWFTLGIKKQFTKFYIDFDKKQSYKTNEDILKNHINKLETEMKVFLNLK